MTAIKMQAPRYFALIPAAGIGARMSAGDTAVTRPKQYLPIGGKPMLRHTLDAFLSSDMITHTFVVVSPQDSVIDSVLPPGGVTVLRCGGDSRMASVQNALAALGDTIAAHDWVLVHDAARPGLNATLIEKLVTTIGDDLVGGLLALPVVDTVKRIAPDAAGGRDILRTVARDGLWLAQTPQMFRFSVLREALAGATDAQAITDDASAVEALGLSPVLVEGHPCNLKVTLPIDIRIAEMYLAAP